MIRRKGHQNYRTKNKTFERRCHEILSDFMDYWPVYHKRYYEERKIIAEILIAHHLGNSDFLNDFQTLWIDLVAHHVSKRFPSSSRYLGNMHFKANH